MTVNTSFDYNTTALGGINQTPTNALVEKSVIPRPSISNNVYLQSVYNGLYWVYVCGCFAILFWIVTSPKAYEKADALQVLVSG